MEYEERIEKLKEMRIGYELSQEILAKESGISREYLNRIEKGKKNPSMKVLERLEQSIRCLTIEEPIFILLDYVRIRFATTEVRWVVEKILRLKLEYMYLEEHAFYGYSAQYTLGDVTVMFSSDEKRGVLLELKGKGCRQFESYLVAQKRNWFDFLRLAKQSGGFIKRLDIAVNDRIGILDIGELIQKCERKECVSLFHSFKGYNNGAFTDETGGIDKSMANGLYIGSMSSEVYFCIYAKDYEQYVKYGIPLDEAEIKNRFEIRLKDERAMLAVDDLISNEDAGRTAFSIINHYIRFVERDDRKRKTDWKTSARWQAFVGMENRKLKLTTAPEPYSYERTLQWMAHQVAPTLKALLLIDQEKNTNFIGHMLGNAQLKERQEKMVERERTGVSEIILEEMGD